MNTQRVEGHTPETTVNANVRCNACTRSLLGVTTANAGTDSQCKPHGYSCGLYGLKPASVQVERLEKVNEALVMALEAILPHAETYARGEHRKNLLVHTPFENACDVASAVLKLAKGPA